MKNLKLQGGILLNTDLLYIRTNRTFTWIRKYGWVFTLLVAIGGLWYPKLGLLVVPIMISLTAFSFLKGRYWCGNFCPHGSLFDTVIMPISRNKKIHGIFKSRITAIMFFSWFTFKLIRKFIKVASVIGTTSFWDKLGLIFVTSYLMVIVIGGIVTIFNNPRSWCNICPMGVLQTISYKLGKLLNVSKNTDVKVTIASKDKCHLCGKCSRVCPMQLEPYTEFNHNNQFDHEECIRCSTCVENCPADILTISTLSDAIQNRDKTDIKGYEDRTKIKSQIININTLDQDLKEFTFEFIQPQEVHYLPGQFILVKIQENPIMYRAYSISSYDEDGRTLSVIIKKAENGYGTNIIFNSFKIGDMVDLEGPLGNELIVDKNAEKVLLVANGIGITPFIPIVRELSEIENNIKEINLVYGVRNEDEFIYDEYFENFVKNNKNFKYTKVVSRPKGDKY